MKKLITAATGTYAIVLMFGGYSSTTVIPASSTQALINQKKCPPAIASFNYGYVFANYITGCDSSITSLEKHPQNLVAPESIATDLVDVPTTTSSSGNSCNSLSSIDSCGYRYGSRSAGFKTVSSRASYR